MTEHQRIKAQLDADVAAYLAGGGTITKHPPTARGREAFTDDTAFPEVTERAVSADIGVM